jgi:hypothetical protein
MSCKEARRLRPHWLRWRLVSGWEIQLAYPI